MGLFDKVKYILVNDTNEEVKTLLKEGGAKREFYLSDLVTHVISDKNEFEQKKEVIELKKPGVSPLWVTLSHTLSGLLPTQPFSILNTGLFGGMVFCTSGIRGDDYKAIWSMVKWNHGVMSSHLNNKCTHLIVGASHSEAKYKAAAANKIPVIVASWVIESISTGVLQPTGPFAPLMASSDLPQQQLQRQESNPLLTPPVRMEEDDKKKKSRKTTKKTTPAKRPDPKDMNMFHIQQQMIQQQQGVRFNHDLQGMQPLQGQPPYGQQQQQYMNNPAQYMQYQQMQQQMRAQQQFPPGHPNYRPQWQHYQQQMMNQKQQGFFPQNQSQMYRHPQPAPNQQFPPNQWSQGHPQYPQGMQGQAPKAAITPAPQPAGAKVEAKTSSYNTLEGCHLMLIDYPDYYSKEVINKWRMAIEEHGGQVALFYNPVYVTHVICMSRMSDIYKRALEDGKCVSTAHWLNDVVIGKEYTLPHNPLHIPTQFKTGLPDCAKMRISVTGYEGKERIYVKDMIKVIGAVYSGELSQENTHLISRKNDGLKYTKANKWGIKIVNARWLADIVLYGVVSVTTEKKYTTLGDPKEMILSDSVMPKLQDAWADFTVPSDTSDGQPPLKKPCVNKFYTPTIVFTGLPSVGKGTVFNSLTSPGRRTSSASPLPPTITIFHDCPDLRHIIKANKNQKLTQLVKKMGCKLTTDVREATHLVTCKIVRTVKFLSAISQCNHIVNPTWVEQSCARKMLLDEMPFTLEDKESEATLGFSVRDSLAKSRLKKVFEGMEMFLTGHIQPGPRDMKTIVECGKGLIIPEQEALRRLGQKPEDRKTFIVISCGQDFEICQQFFQRDVQIYTAEFVLSGVLTQSIDYNANKLFVQEFAPDEVLF